MPLRCTFLGRMPYADAVDAQEDLVRRVRSGEAPSTLLLLEHPAVITLGRSSDPAHVVAPPEDLAERGIEIHDAGRGGDVTYHGPGQLVGYPIVALCGPRRDAHRYLRDLEAALIAALARFGVASGRVPGLTGVWVGGAKIASIGVRIGTGWITSHGFALNVARDLSGFGLIVPCGLHGKPVTSLSWCTGRDLAIGDTAPVVAEEIAAALGFDLERDDALFSGPVRAIS